ncbi:MAG: DNA-directed RNA polymerase subunit beta', partial [Actinobacteria bacterium]|nr:DNA-directed RNA polymerase subunit beta' [Actinomycetota bacterium]
KDGLFCEKIFGPTRDWECYCGKYKRVRFKGIVCERCGVEVTRAKVRRERMGHIELAAPVTHIWYFKGVPSRLGYLLDLAPKDLEKVIYFAAYMITEVDEEGRHEALPTLEAKLAKERKAIEDRTNHDAQKRLEKMEEDLATLEAEGAKSDARRKVRETGEREATQIRKRGQNEVDRLERVFNRFKGLKVQDLEGDEILYREMRDKYGRWFKGGMGAEAIKRRLETFDLVAEATRLRELAVTSKGQKKTRSLKRLKVVSAFLQTGVSPMGMVLDAVPVIPPDLRPMVQLDGGRFATSDLNDLYRRVINRNNRLKRLLDLGAPEIIINNEKRMLQESVDSLFDNGRRGRAVTGPGNRALKSLSDMLKGKQGRFRQNLLGKRVDYSGRSVIVVGPQLKLHQCGLPKQMALELFKPFVMKRLVEMNHAQNIKSAKRMVERSRSVVWDVLEEVITEHPVLLNRAPTLHRLGIQAFEPQLIEGKAIQIHPLVCTAFNADFDGDQMAVHVPLSAEAQAEARVLMLSSNNILSPADGRPITSPTQDMVLGIYFLTQEVAGQPGEGRAFSSVAEAIAAFDRGALRHKHAGEASADFGQHNVEPMLSLQAPITLRLDAATVPPADWVAPAGWKPGMPVTLRTTLGRALFNEALPVEWPYVNKQVGKRELAELINEMSARLPKVTIGACLDALKDLGFRWATRSGVTISISDVVTPPKKAEIMTKAETDAAKIQQNYERGVITDAERRQELIQVWTKATDDVASAMRDYFPADNPVFMMVNSGARGNWMQVRQIAGMRGLVANPKGEIIPRPIKANFREGLTVLEYFISTHVVSRCLSDDVVVDGKTIAAAGEDLGLTDVDRLIAAGVTEVKVRSLLTCESKVGTCARCYGRSLATGKLVDIGEAVGIIAAQSIGEPGTQLTMRTFHTGGVAGEDITHGLPRVVELFEARTPKGLTPIAKATGRVRIEHGERNDTIILTPDDGSEATEYTVSKRARLKIADGDHVEAGREFIQGKPDPKDVLDILGPRAVQEHLVQEVQEVYRSQGVTIHDKHIEVIVRQMLKRVTVLESGDTPMLAGELKDRTAFEAYNRAAVADGKQPASGRPTLMGITKASLATDSWLSAASFQETTRVLTEAAIQGRRDPLLGLKENVIIGKLIPAGTGLGLYRNVRVEPTEEAKAEMYASMGVGMDIDYSATFAAGGGEAVPLEEFDAGYRG